jgi:hypothetical protein
MSQRVCLFFGVAIDNYLQVRGSRWGQHMMVFAGCSDCFEKCSALPSSCDVYRVAVSDVSSMSSATSGDSTDSSS